MKPDGGWIDVELDGTLAHMPTGPEVNGINLDRDGPIGAPVAAVANKVKALLKHPGFKIRIVTDRVYPFAGVYGPDRAPLEWPRDTWPEQNRIMPRIKTIQAWCLEHLGQVLPITCMINPDMTSFWSNRSRDLRTENSSSVQARLERRVTEDDFMDLAERLVNDVATAMASAQVFRDLGRPEGSYESLESTLKRDVVCTVREAFKDLVAADVG